MNSDQTINVLVTAVGGELAMSVLKALKCSNLDLRIIGCDIFEDIAGRKWCDTVYKAPLATNHGSYLEFIENLVREENIHVIIPTADVEFPLYAGNLNRFKPAKVLVQDEKEWNRFSDKWTAFEWFRDHDISTPITLLPRDNAIASISFPCIVKPRVGGGSRHIIVVQNQGELSKALEAVPKPIIQALILPNEEEYTAGTFRWSNGKIDVIVMRRTLKFGMTNKAWTVDRPDLIEFCHNVIKNTNLVGSNNIQFRVDEEGPKVLEINHRFSGTTGIRANFGFNDPEMWIRDVLGLSRIQPTIRHGKVVRYMEEIYTYE